MQKELESIRFTRNNTYVSSSGEVNLLEVRVEPGLFLSSLDAVRKGAPSCKQKRRIYPSQTEADVGQA